MTAVSAAVVGAVGGAGATRVTVELGALLAREGRDVAVLDAAYDTEGLARHAPGRVDPDATALVTDPDVAPADALVNHPVEGLSGRLALCPAYAPFERLARAKAPDAARALGDAAETLRDEFDHVLIDAPPVAANQAVAAVARADRVGAVYPPTDRGIDGLQRTRGRIADVGATLDCVIANRADGDLPPDADCAIPTADAAAPACLDEAPVAAGVADAAAALLDVSLDVDAAGLLDSARRRLQ